ncbi:hypothetical protein [Parathermosynechococcus lividus]
MDVRLEAGLVCVTCGLSILRLAPTPLPRVSRWCELHAIQTQLRFQGGRKLLETVTRINDFRNIYIAHQEQELTDKNLTSGQNPTVRLELR